jgi:hypothetical protein
MPQWILLRGRHKFSSFELWTERETSRVDYTERRKSERILIVFLLKSGGGGDFVPPPSGGRWWFYPPSLPLPPPPSPSLPPKERGKGGGGGGGGDGGGGGRPWNVFQQVWTCFNRFERVSTGSNGGVPRWGWGLVWLIHQTACSFLMISPKLYAIWPILFSILLQYFLVVLLILFATLGVG